MKATPYIVNEQLPVTQDFRLLKEEGLALIQAFGGTAWTNLNASDPGVTILEQLCFALTELGYCTDFPITDILTKQNGTLPTENQFYLPENILTTAPVTADDYRKYLIDALPGIDNALIVPVDNPYPGVNSAYTVYLLPDQTVSYPKALQELCTHAFFLLNKSRNIGELFLFPQVLEAVAYTVNGILEIADETELTTTLLLLQNTIRNYILPTVVPTGYNQLTATGMTINQVMNGPLLKRGWIETGALGAKKDTLRTLDLYQLFQSVKGVTVSSPLQFQQQNKNAQATSNISAAANELLVVDLFTSWKSGKLEIRSNGRTIPAQTSHSATSGLFSSELNLFNTEVHLQPTLPTGTYRNINSYYSIQHTFPEIFAVGEDSVNSNATNFQIAQSRQLKGYLTLFDQLLANQFSQLANVDQLFSFKNSLSGTPSDEDAFYAIKDTYEKEHLEYPVPYQIFSPTYFYQSLYDIPHVKPLLKDHDAFAFSFEIESEKELEHKSWEEYKLDPYNSYIKGLMDFMEDETVSLSRRSNVLDHLLARHGESPLVIDALITGSDYSGDELKDHVIFKSLLLQNLGILSYYRQKAYNYTVAIKINPAVEKLPSEVVLQLLNGNDTDFIVNSDRIDATEKLTESDFSNYSALELKLNLLFGLRVQYTNYILNNYENSATNHQVKQAYWLKEQRRGCILFETDLLLQTAGFEILFTADPVSGPFLKISKQLTYGQALTLGNALDNGHFSLSTANEQETLTVGNFSYNLETIQLQSKPENSFKPLSGTAYYYTVNAKWNNQTTIPADNGLFAPAIYLFLPDYLPQFATQEFRNRLNLFLETTLPVRLDCAIHFLNAEQFDQLIPAYANWHNALVYNAKENGKSAANTTAGSLIDFLVQFFPSDDA